MNILELVREFYAIEALETIVLLDGKLERFRHSHVRWYQDLSQFRERFNAKLAHAIYDYTAIVVAGEMRHAIGQASNYIAAFYSSNMRREAVYEDCIKYTPESIIRAGKLIFDYDIEWDSHYGGKKWLMIAKAGGYYGNLPNSVFIDHCVDLTHNTSVYFDKGANIFDSFLQCEYLYFLEYKKISRPTRLLENINGNEFNRILRRAVNLGIVEPSFIMPSYYLESSEACLFDYEPVSWGDEVLECKLGRELVCLPKVDKVRCFQDLKVAA